MARAESGELANFGKATALVIDGSQQGLDLTCQMLLGFGLREVAGCMSVAEANERLAAMTFDMIVLDPAVGAGGEGYDFVKQLRRSGGEHASVPVILQTGHVRTSDVRRARDSGANIVVLKPISPANLIKRVLWVARDPRPFVETAVYVGPDRRFKLDGPPAGSDGRRADDSSLDLAQPEPDAAPSAQKVML